MPSAPDSPAPDAIPAQVTAQTTAPAPAPTTEDLRLDANNWQRLQDLYHLLEITPPGQQAEVLAQATADPTLRARVLSLLATSAAPDAGSPSLQPPIAPGARVGPYAIIRHLGSGGLGSVYLIERMLGGAVQRCALKLLAMRSTEPAFRARFEREQQILATLQHPNITHLLDAGSSDLGQPYLVMDFVDGLDLTRFCDGNRLSVRARIELFLSICEAVTYAHSKLVVHLDLKPSNILITASGQAPGQAKLLDFGTSKLIESETTGTTTILATPAYASPEQLRGEPVTTSCDLYSLGVILYELLTGRRPFDSNPAVPASPAAALHRAATEQEPPSLSAAVTDGLPGTPPDRLRRLLHGDLSSIVARCLRSRPRDRYNSVEALSEDLKRYLAGLPVLARRQTATYRLAKFLRRHRVSLALSAAVLTLLVVAGSYAWMRQQQALQQGRRAEQMQSFLSQLIRLANQQQTGKAATTVPEFLDLGVKVLPQILHDPDDRRAAQLSLGESLYDSHDYARALPVLNDVAASARLAGDVQTETEASAFAGLSANLLGSSQLAATLTDRALALSHVRGVGLSARIWAEGAWGYTHDAQNTESARSLTLLAQAVAESRNPAISDRERLWMLEQTALRDQLHGKLADAEQLTGEAFHLVKDQPYALCDRASILQIQGNLVAFEGNDAGSLPLYRSAIAAATACSGAASNFTLFVESYLARALINTGQSDQAIALLEQALPLWQRSADTLNMGMAQIYLSRAYLLSHRPQQAETAAREALATQQGKVNPYSTRMAISHLELAQALAAQKRYPEALAEAILSNQIYDHVRNMQSIEESYHHQAQQLLHDLQNPPPQAPH